MKNEYLGYVIDQRDNVGVALHSLAEGEIGLSGALRGVRITVCQPIPAGHKFALRTIAAGEPVVKFGGRIGTATRDIEKGAYVHLHNMRSDFDEYAATLDVETALDHQIAYQLEEDREEKN